MNNHKRSSAFDPCFAKRKTRIKSLRWLAGFALVVGLNWSGAIVQAQQPTKTFRIGLLVASPASAVATRIEAFRMALRELGHSEGKAFVLELRSAEGKLDRLPDLAAELVRLKVDIIVTGGPTATAPASAATKTIPIVMAQDSDPVGNGFVASLARPGGNITGLSNFSPEISGKRLELLKEIVPKISRVAVLGSATEPGNSIALSETKRAAGALAVKLNYLEVRDPQDIEIAFTSATKSRTDAALVLAGAVFNSHRSRLVELANTSRLPTIYAQSEFPESGGLIYYGSSINDLFRRAAVMVDKIVKGANPADIPIESPTKFEMVVNLKTAKQIGLTMPPNVLARADRVIR
jgi:putative ABC transport system substrate-binding protein